MGVNLKYDLEDITEQRKNIATLKSSISDAKTAMVKGLDQIRLDWVSEGGTAFFESIDTDWLDGIQNCIDVIDDLLSAIDKASEKYREINENASNYLEF